MFAFHVRGPYRSQKWRSHRSKVLGLALDYDIFLLGRALAAAICGHWIKQSHKGYGPGCLVQHLSFKGTSLQQKVNRAGWTSQVNYWRDGQCQNVFFQLMFRELFAQWIDRNDSTSRTRSSYAWCRQLLSRVKSWQVQPMHPRMTFCSSPIIQ